MEIVNAFGPSLNSAFISDKFVDDFITGTINGACELEYTFLEVSFMCVFPPQAVFLRHGPCE